MNNEASGIRLSMDEEDGKQPEDMLLQISNKQINNSIAN